MSIVEEARWLLEQHDHVLGPLSTEGPRLVAGLLAAYQEMANNAMACSIQSMDWQVRAALRKLTDTWDIHDAHYNGTISDSSEWDYDKAHDHKHEFDSAWWPALAEARRIVGACGCGASPPCGEVAPGLRRCQADRLALDGEKGA